LAKFTQTSGILTLIKSISGFRGTIGGTPGEALTPVDITNLTAGFGQWLKDRTPHPRVVLGRDGRVTGPLVQSLITNTLLMQGVDVIDAGLTTTPTVEMAVPYKKAQGGIIITASHNPMNWNALKLLNSVGEFLGAEEGQAVIEYGERVHELEFATIDELGLYQSGGDLLDYHIKRILQLPYVDVEGIKKAGLKVVLDPVNSSGAIAVKILLDALNVGCETIHGEINGIFAHNPEPLASNLTDLSAAVISASADMGIAVDPDVDRLAFVCENGEMFGEENTLVAVSDYVLAIKPGSTVSNLSSTRGLRDITAKYGQTYHPSAVGEVNVVEMMKKQQAVIGGEGNGGVILPDLHYGRDALAGIALFLSYHVKEKKTISEIKNSLPTYHMSKMKVNLRADMNPQILLDHMKNRYTNHSGLNLVDGVKIDFDQSWIHMRKSNTEAIIRIYAEASTPQKAQELADRFKNEILAI
jgi:phosphomannomutase